ncbi:hypothetical protein N1851_024633 [Merluccius polli]|uniref:Uncharacterized protein n=1 Tax=Merluccius polli TaxID=89951 RepID=A0AA47MET3_MERPO|nr:hypothetical protein N1851_024633 [Merluccius polli]
MFLETETEKDKHCNVWTRKSKSKGPREKSRPSERCRSSERSRARDKSRPKERARCQVGPYNTERLLAFLNDLHQCLVPEQDQEGENMRTFVITWDNVAFHQHGLKSTQDWRTRSLSFPRTGASAGGATFLCAARLNRAPSASPSVNMRGRAAGVGQ